MLIAQTMTSDADWCSPPPIASSSFWRPTPSMLARGNGLLMERAVEKALRSSAKRKRDIILTMCTRFRFKGENALTCVQLRTRYTRYHLRSWNWIWWVLIGTIQICFLSEIRERLYRKIFILFLTNVYYSVMRSFSSV